jgi:hypothetical protein
VGTGASNAKVQYLLNRKHCVISIIDSNKGRQGIFFWSTINKELFTQSSNVAVILHDRNHTTPKMTIDHFIKNQKTKAITPYLSSLRRVPTKGSNGWVRKITTGNSGTGKFIPLMGH